MQLRAEPSSLLGSGLEFAQHELDWIAGDQLQHREDRQGDAQQNRDRGGDAAGDVCVHLGGDPCARDTAIRDARAMWTKLALRAGNYLIVMSVTSG